MKCGPFITREQAIELLECEDAASPLPWPQTPWGRIAMVQSLLYEYEIDEAEDELPKAFVGAGHER